MLGSAVETALRSAGLPHEALSRSGPGSFEATEPDSLRPYLKQLDEGDYVVNCVGLTKSNIDDKSPSSREDAVRINYFFPAALAALADSRKLRVIQVATDCVFSGRTGDYSEEDPHDAFDVYGKTKSLGEIHSNGVMHLRCSLIGPELGRSSLFFEWVRQQPQNAVIDGYTTHIWNGITSRTFGNIVAGLISNDLFKPGIQHVVPRDKVSKYELVLNLLNLLGRSDVQVNALEVTPAVDRSLRTLNPEMNQALFEGAGLNVVPSIFELLQDMLDSMKDLHS